MRKVETRRPSFPALAPDSSIAGAPGRVWQVLCGDSGHWRAGLYSPAFYRRDQITELEQHDCPEFFFTLRGRLVLVLESGPGRLREVELVAGRGILVQAPHNGYCPEGPHTAQVLVVERDEFDTVYHDLVAEDGEE